MQNYACRGYKKSIKSDEIKKFFKIKKKISIVIPTYNEEENIEKTTGEIKKAMASTGYGENYEIVVVDDNSRDKTPSIIDDLAKKGDFIALHRYNKRGIFSAILDGIKAANGEFILMMGADLSHPPEIIPEMLRHMWDYDIVSGSRYIEGGGMNAPFLRKWGSFYLNKICAFIIGLNIRDITGVFHLMKKEKFMKLKFEYRAVFGELDFEFFKRALENGFSIKEVPFVYKFRKSGKSKMEGVFKVACIYLKRAIQLRME